jgi:hypothetical protein
MMDLLPKALRKQVPPLYATEHDEDPMVWCRFFYPFSTWSWYVTEFDGDDTFFGLVEGFEVELGYFSLSEMVKTREAKGCPIERDVRFQPCPLSKIRADIERKRQEQANY